MQCDTRAFRREGARAAGADAARGARDEHALAAKPRLHAERLQPVIKFEARTAEGGVTCLTPTT
jgi:hypothetical protein